MDNDFILVQNKRSKKKHKVDDNTTIINNHRTKKSNKMIIYDQYTNNINNISNINNTYDIAELFIKPKNSIIIKHTDQLCVDITYQNNNIDNDNKNSDPGKHQNIGERKMQLATEQVLCSDLMSHL